MRPLPFVLREAWACGCVIHARAQDSFYAASQRSPQNGLHCNMQITDSFRVLVIGMPKADRQTNIGGVNDIGTRLPRANHIARAAGAL